MKRKILLSPLIIVVLIIVLGVGAAGAAVLLGGGGNTENVNLSKGLVGWWKMDGNAKDSTPQGNNGTVTGATLSNDRKTQALKSYLFDGNDDINIGDPSSGIYDFGTGSFTYSFWLSSGTDDTGAVVGKRQSTTTPGNAGFLILRTTSGRFNFYLDDGTNGVTTQTATSTVPNNTWAHWVVVVDRSAQVMTLYKNGVSNTTSSSISSVGSISNTQNLRFGVLSGGVSSPFTQGTMDDIRIWNRALSTTEITALSQEYDPGIQVSDLQKGLVGWWKMDGNAKDSTPYANDGTVTSATLVNDRKSQANRAYSFNGTTSVITAGTVSALDDMAAFSVSAWINPTTAGENSLGFIMVKQSSLNVNGWQFQLDSSTGTNRIDFLVDYSTTDLLVRSNDNAITLGQWQHVLVTWNGSSTATNVHIYVNGTEVTYAVQTNGVGSRVTDAGQIIRIGNEPGGARTFDGSIDDARIYNRVLSATEITALSQEYDPGIQVSNLSKGLVGSWSLDENAKDRSPYENNGTVTGAGLTTDRKSQVNKAYSFDGNDHISIGDPSSGILDFGTGDFSVSLWILRNTNATTNLRVTSKGGSSDTTAGWGIDGSDTVAVFRISDGGPRTTVSFGTITTGTWYHLVVIRSGASVKTYLNGSQANTTASAPTGSVSNTINFTIGALDVGGVSLQWDGKLDDVRLYNRALTTTEITQLYESY